MKGFANHHIDDKSLKENFYPQKDENGKALLDTIVELRIANARGLISLRKWRRYLRTTKLGALESLTPGETPSLLKLHTIQPQMRFARRWGRLELS